MARETSGTRPIDDAIERRKKKEENFCYVSRAHILFLFCISHSLPSPQVGRGGLRRERKQEKRKEERAVPTMEAIPQSDPNCPCGDGGCGGGTRPYQSALGWDEQREIMRVLLEMDVKAALRLSATSADQRRLLVSLGPYISRRAFVIGTSLSVPETLREALARSRHSGGGMRLADSAFAAASCVLAAFVCVLLSGGMNDDMREALDRLPLRRRVAVLYGWVVGAAYASHRPNPAHSPLFGHFSTPSNPIVRRICIEAIAGGRTIPIGNAPPLPVGPLEAPRSPAAGRLLDVSVMSTRDCRPMESAAPLHLVTKARRRPRLAVKASSRGPSADVRSDDARANMSRYWDAIVRAAMRDAPPCGDAAPSFSTFFDGPMYIVPGDDRYGYGYLIMDVRSHAIERLLDESGQSVPRMDAGEKSAETCPVLFHSLPFSPAVARSVPQGETPKISHHAKE
jgi:hypothetical protein